MKVILVGILFSVTTLAQNLPSRIAPACGPGDLSFKVKLDKSQHTVVQPPSGDAQVYFIQDKGSAPLGIGAAVLSRNGIDGQWVGMNKNNSYFSVSVKPGEHHVCAFVGVDGPVELSEFKAEAGHVYYFRERLVPTGYGWFWFLNPVNSDEANHLIESFPLSVSHPRKFIWHR